MAALANADVVHHQSETAGRPLPGGNHKARPPALAS
jgi:hypothetical protein